MNRAAGTRPLGFVYAPAAGGRTPARQPGAPGARRRLAATERGAGAARHHGRPQPDLPLRLLHGRAHGPRAGTAEAGDRQHPGGQPGADLAVRHGDLLQGNPLGFVYARQYAAPAEPGHPGDAAARATTPRRSATTSTTTGSSTWTGPSPQAGFPFVSANVFVAGTDRHAYRPVGAAAARGRQPGDTILIGVTGNTPPGVALWDRGNVRADWSSADVVPARARRGPRAARRRGGPRGSPVRMAGSRARATTRW